MDYPVAAIMLFSDEQTNDADQGGAHRGVPMAQSNGLILSEYIQEVRNALR
jgi:hypothetical protein